MNKEIKRLVRELRKDGCTVEITGSGHHRVTLPNGKRLSFSNSPSCPFATKKIKSDLRRAEQGAY